MTNTPPPPSTAPPPLPSQEPRPPRPTTVTAAAGLLLVAAALSVIGAIVSVLTQDSVQKAADEFAEANNTTANSGSAQQIGGIIFSLVFAAALVALALGVLRGANVARIITWVLCGLGLCCTGTLTAFSLVLVEYLPGGYVAYMYTVTAVTIIIYIAIIVLLALPASNNYFRKPKAGF